MILDPPQIHPIDSGEAIPVQSPEEIRIVESAVEALKTVTEGVVSSHGKSVDANNALTNTVVNRYMDYLDKHPEFSGEQKERIMDRIDRSTESCMEQAKDQKDLLKSILGIIRDACFIVGGLVGLRLFFSFLKDVIKTVSKRA